MKKILLLSIFSTLFGQIQYSGYINTEAKIRNNTREVLDLPYRLSQFNFSYTFAMIDIISKGDVQFRNKTNEALFSLREFYIGFYPSFGEIRFGKQINSWGLADGNNPTDNLNPYDLNYMFLTGTDRKISSLSLTFDTYMNDYKLGMVLIPNHEPNRFPIKDTDFKIGDNDPPPSIENEDEFQWGLSLQNMLGESDIMLTYFNGYDFSPSYAGNYNQFEYRKTQVFGVSTVSFWNDLTFRTEFAYFDTKTALDLDLSANYKAEYLQYVFQLEYPAPSDITFTSQIIGNKMISISGDNFDDKKIPPVIPANTENFNMGLGTPFAAFSENVLFLSSQKKYMDGTFDISLVGMIDLTQTGFMFGTNIEYSPFENWMVTAGTSKFIGDGKDESHNIFNALEDFSNTTIAVKFSF
jgi:hypothetical protein